jgi:hypothetical protein
MDVRATADGWRRHGRRSRVVLIPRRWYPAQRAQARCRDTVAKKPGAPRRSRISRNTIRAGRAGMSRPNLWFLPRAFCSHGGHGGGELPAFPAPSRFQEGHDCRMPRARCAARTRVHVSRCLIRGSDDELARWSDQSLAVVPRAGGGPSIPEASAIDREAAAYWIIRLRG